MIRRKSRGDVQMAAINGGLAKLTAAVQASAKRTAATLDGAVIASTVLKDLPTYPD